MTRIALPVEVNRVIARRAVQKARQDMWRRGWKSSGALQPYSGDGEVGISSTVKFLMIQNKGFSPFVMYWVAGRTLPLGCKQGDGPHFRNGKNVGTPGYVEIPHRGRVWRQQRWRHPGLPRKAFLETAIQGAIKESRRDIQDAIMTCLRGDKL